MRIIWNTLNGWLLRVASMRWWCPLVPSNQEPDQDLKYLIHLNLVHGPLQMMICGMWQTKVSSHSYLRSVCIYPQAMNSYIPSLLGPIQCTHLNFYRLITNWSHHRDYMLCVGYPRGPAHGYSAQIILWYTSSFKATIKFVQLQPYWTSRWAKADIRWYISPCKWSSWPPCYNGTSYSTLRIFNQFIWLVKSNGTGIK